MDKNVKKDAIKRRLEYIKFGNKELIKAHAKKPFSNAIIAACYRVQKAILQSEKPIVRIKADGSKEFIENKTMEVDTKIFAA